MKGTGDGHRRGGSGRSRSSSRNRSRIRRGYELSSRADLPGKSSSFSSSQQSFEAAAITAVTCKHDSARDRNTSTSTC